MIAYREQILAQLAAAVDEGRRQPSALAVASPLTAQGLIGAAVRVLYTRLTAKHPEPLASLHGALMEMIVLPYLGARAAPAKNTCARRHRPHALGPPRKPRRRAE